jgi:hypothetical protein
MSLTLFVEVKSDDEITEDNKFGDIYPKHLPGWDKLFDDVLTKRRKERGSNGDNRENSEKS